MPPVSRFGGGRAVKKQGVIARLLAYLEKFYGIGVSESFVDNDKAVD